MKKFTHLLLLFLGMNAYLFAQMPAAIEIFPENAGGWDEITLTFKAEQACTPEDKGNLLGLAQVMMHSGVYTLGDDQDAEWGPTAIDYDAQGANGESPILISNDDETYTFTFIPGEFYGLEDGEIITQISAVFNNGSWANEGKDYIDGACGNFYIPLSYTSGEPSFSFKLNMNKLYSDGGFDPADPVYVEVGDLPEVELIDLDANFENDRIYEGVLEEGLTVDQVYDLKFRFGDDNYETVTRTITAVGGKTTVDVWWNDEGLTKVTLVVDMTYQMSGQVSATGNFDPTTDYIDVAGNFNSWDGTNHHLTKVEGSDSLYSVDIIEGIEPEDMIEYKFRINGSWDTSEFPGGGANRLYVIPEGESTVKHIYDKFWPGKALVTFKCNMEYQIFKEAFVFGTDFLDVAGDLNNWNGASSVFTHTTDSIYAIDILVKIGFSFSYKYRLNGDWSTSEFPGGSNRTYTVLDPAEGETNIIDLWYNDDNPAVAIAPRANKVEITGAFRVGEELTGSYEYEDVNGDAEGTTTFQWFSADTVDVNAATAIDGATSATYTPVEADHSKYIFFEVRPVAGASTPDGDLLNGDTVIVAGQMIFNVSISGVNAENVSIYPNPFNSTVTIENISSVSTIIVSNIIGQEMTRIDNSGSEMLQINTSDLRTGVYFVTLIGIDGSQNSAKIIKE